VLIGDLGDRAANEVVDVVAVVSDAGETANIQLKVARHGSIKRNVYVHYDMHIKKDR
jgi:hypothetical protein